MKSFTKNNPKYGDEDLVTFGNKSWKLGLNYIERQICISDNSIVVNKRVCKKSKG